MAQEWAQEGLRIFLMDLGLEEPSLHEVLDLPNGEGVSEAFLFGASVQHIAKPALNNAIFFASAGAPPGDPEEVLGHSRWNDLAGGFSEAEATLLLFLPTDIPGAGKILSRATDIIFLAGRGESAETHLGPASIKVVTTLGPLGTPSGDVTAPEGSVSSPPPLHEPGATDRDPGVAEGPGEGIDLVPPSPDFDFEGTLELAEGFSFDLAEDVDSQGTEPAREEAVQAPDATVAEPFFTGTTSGREEDIRESEREVEEEGSPSEARESGPSFGNDLQMGASLAESVGVEAEEAEEGEEVRSRAPDFEAHFVDLPPAGGEEPDWAREDEFGQDLVHGPDFGVPGGPLPEEEREVRIEPPEELPTPPAPAGPAQDLPVPERRRPPRRKPPKKKVPWGRIGAALIALAVLGSAVGTATGYLDVPGFGFLRSFFAEIPDPPLTLAGPQANEEVLRFSLVLFEYDEEELDDGLEMLDALQARLPRLLLTLVPGEVDGERIYTLLAGPAVDRVEAENLRAPIAEVLVREDPASWSVRETPRAFYLGERGTLEEARAYLESVAPDDLHAYILHVTFPEPEGSESYQILTGAFAGIPDARPLQLILRDLGFRDAPLIERRGRLPE
jgi:hypothetical protein